MTQQQYAIQVINLSAFGQSSDAYADLDQEQLETLIFLLDVAKEAAEARRAAIANNAAQ